MTSSTFLSFYLSFFLSFFLLFLDTVVYCYYFSSSTTCCILPYYGTGIAAGPLLFLTSDDYIPHTQQPDLMFFFGGFSSDQTKRTIIAVIAYVYIHLTCPPDLSLFFFYLYFLSFLSLYSSLSLSVASLLQLTIKTNQNFLTE